MIGQFNILLFEDQPSDKRLIEFYLDEGKYVRDYELFHHTRLEDGLKRLRDPHQPPIHIVLLDLSLLDSDWEETMQRLKEGAFEGFPVIVLTSGNPDENLGNKAIDYGAQWFIEKGEISAYTLGTSLTFSLKQYQTQERLTESQKIAKMGGWEMVETSDGYQFTGTPELYRLLGNPRHLTLDTYQDFLAIVHPDDVDVVKEVMMAISESETLTSLDHRILLNGKTLFVQLQGKKGFDPLSRKPRLVGTLQDKTEFKRIEDLERKKELAEQSAKMKQDFLANTSHEIRTPLNGILQLTRILLSRSPLPSQLEYLHSIESAGKTLLAVVNDVLDLSKIEAGKIDFHQADFSVPHVIGSVVDILESKVQAKGIELRVRLDQALPQVVSGDPVRLQQILFNLIGNAIKFTEEGYIQVYVSLHKCDSQRACLKFEITDTGIGIPPDQLSSIFESFQQVTTHQAYHYRGTGLGLAIVERLVQLQGGKVGVESEQGVGSTFRFYLPFDISEKQLKDLALSEQNMPTRGSLDGVHILVVEDNQLNQLVTHTILSDWGVTVEIADNGKKAINKLKNNEYDLVLMDLQMPEMDGYRATELIRSEFNAPKRDIPIIALTANAFTGMDDECLKVGMNDYVSKPFELNNLHQKIIHNLPEEKIISLKKRVDNPSDEAETSQVSPNISPAKQGYNGHKPVKIDLSRIQEIAKGDSLIVKTLITKIQENTFDLLEQLQQELSYENYEGVAERAHTLKGSVSYLNIEGFMDLIQEVEHMARNSQLASLEQLQIGIQKTERLLKTAFKQLEATQELLPS
ncbi:MAG: response regulator [Bacteroidota bacterium]